MSRLTYCAKVWGFALPKYLLERLYQIQKRAIVFNVDYKASTYNNIFTLEKLLLFNRGTSIFMTFSANVQMLVDKLRSCSNKNLILPRIKVGCCGANMWNSLPLAIRNVNSLYVFKYRPKLKNFLLDTENIMFDILVLLSILSQMIMNFNFYFL